MRRMIQSEETTALEEQRIDSELLLGKADGGFLDFAAQLSEWKWFVAKFVAVCVLIAAIAAWVWPKSYTATTRIMPPQQSQSSLASSMLGQLGSLAGLTGSSLGLGKSSSDVYLYVLHSRTVADALIDRFGLMGAYRTTRRTSAEDTLRDNSEISSGKEGGISVSVTDRDPQRAADIANGYVEELKGLTQTLAVTEAGRRRLFFEHEVQRASEDLSNAELAMKKTQEETGVFLLEPQSRAMIENLTGLQARIAAKETQVQSMRTFATDENPAFKTAQSELAAMRAELGRMESGQLGSSIADMDMRKIPEKGLAYVRALREVKYREALLEAMMKEYELARVDEAKDAAIIQVLDPAVRPELKSSPKRALVVGSTALISFFLAIGIALLVDEGQKHARVAAQFGALKTRLSGQLRSRRG